VIDDGIEAYNVHQRATRDEPCRADRKSDRALLDRITVNYLRHNVTNYDDMLQELRGKSVCVTPKTSSASVSTRQPPVDSPSWPKRAVGNCAAAELHEQEDHDDDGDDTR